MKQSLLPLLLLSAGARAQVIEGLVQLDKLTVDKVSLVGKRHPEQADCHPEQADCHPEQANWLPEQAECHPE